MLAKAFRLFQFLIGSMKDAVVKGEKVEVNGSFNSL